MTLSEKGAADVMSLEKMSEQRRGVSAKVDGGWSDLLERVGMIVEWGCAEVEVVIIS